MAPAPLALDLRSGRELIRGLADQAFSRTAGAPLLAGNAVKVLRDATENYPAWERAIATARSTIHVEMYIIRNDRTGRRFRDLLVERAKAGVAVRVLHDWFGSLSAGRLLRPLRDAGGEVHACNPPTLDSVLGWLSRNHRKVLSIDGEVAYVSGLCIGDAWVGDPERGIEPWRDTGIELEGPAVAEVERAFLRSWTESGGTAFEPPAPAPGARSAGEVALRVIATTPRDASLYRLDLLVAAMARRSLWITDAYFLGTPAYVQALASAARDAIDVRLLLPRASDLPWVASLSRTYYRPLLEAGVLIFEWNGSMVHAKTAVADGRWTRVGSTNLNLSSWLGNYELDVAIEDEGVAQQMEAMFSRDLEAATEVVLDERRRRPRLKTARGRATPTPMRVRASGGRALRGAAQLGSTVGAAVTGYRDLARAEARPLVVVGAILLLLAVLFLVFPLLPAVGLAFLSGWFALVMLVRAYRALSRDGG